MATVDRYGGVSAGERRAARRSRLLDAARDVLATEGLTKLTVTGVCARAGLTQRYFYESFANRDALLDELFATIAAETAVDIFGSVAREGTSPRERIRAAITAAIDVLASDSLLGRVVAQMGTDETLLRHRAALTRQIADLAREYASVVWGAPAPESPDVRMAILFVIGGAGEVVVDWLSGSLDITRAQLIETCTDIVLSAGTTILKQTVARL
jgi:AcrR family transcriptional regulator